jgi:amino acid transporter
VSTLMRGERPAEFRHNAIGLVGVLAQSVAEIGPTASVALAVPLVAITVGRGAWLSWVLCTIATIGVAYCCAEMSKRYVTTSGLTGLTAGTGSRATAIAVALCVLVFFLSVLPQALLATALLFQNWFATVHVGSSNWLLFVIGMVVLVTSFYLPFRGVRVAAEFQLILEGITVLLVAILVVAIIVREHSHLVDTAQLRLSGVSFRAILAGAAVAMFGFVSFENSVTLGQETRDATKAIPRSLYISVIACGLIFTIPAYVLPIGFRGSHLSLATSASPLSDLAKLNGVGAISSPLTLGVAISFFSIIIALVNAGARYLYTMSIEGLAPKWFGTLNRRTQTPARAMLFFGVLTGGTFIGLVASGNATFAVWGNIATFLTLMYVVAYVLAIPAIAYYMRNTSKRWPVLLATVVAIVVLGYGLYASVTPVPASPLDIWTYVAIGLAVAACVVAVVLRVRHSPVLQLVGSSSDYTEHTGEEVANAPQES